MATSSFYKFNQFVEDLGHSLHVLDTNEVKILLTNTVPNAADNVIDTVSTPCIVKATSNAVEVAAAAGYVKGGEIITVPVFAQIGGVAKFYGVKVTWTAGAAIGPFQYAVIYNNSTGAAATRPVIGWYNYGAPVTLGIGETFTIGNSNDGTNWVVGFPILSVT